MTKTPTKKKSLKKSVSKRTVKKANNVISAERVSYITELLMRSVPTHEIVRECSEKWGVVSRQIEKYISAAYAEIRTYVNKKKSDRLAWHYEIRHKIISDSLRQGSPYVALNALQDLTKLEGLYPVEKLEAKVHASHSIAGNKELKDKFYKFLENGSSDKN